MASAKLVGMGFQLLSKYILVPFNSRDMRADVLNIERATDEETDPEGAFPYRIQRRCDTHWQLLTITSRG